ncbi:MAG: outer membrane protein assembly factor BamD [Ignavibacteriales bacterium]|nr:outer membrane protein assembly factor BamD [Ignavibacteriales bacterium]
MKKYFLSILLSFLLLFILSSCSIDDEQLFQQAQQFVNEKKVPEAIKLLQEIVEKKPNGEFGEKSQKTMISLYQIELQNPQMAIQEARRFVELYPNSAQTPSVYFMIGFIFNNDMHQTDSAKIAYTEFLSRYPNSEMAKSAEFELQNLGKDINEIFKAQLTDTTKKPQFTVQSK